MPTAWVPPLLDHLPHPHPLYPLPEPGNSTLASLPLRLTLSAKQQLRLCDTLTAVHAPRARPFVAHHAANLTPITSFHPAAHLGGDCTATGRKQHCQGSHSQLWAQTRPCPMSLAWTTDYLSWNSSSCTSVCPQPNPLTGLYWSSHTQGVASELGGHAGT